MDPRGDYIGGRFHAPTGDGFSSHDPAREGVVVLHTAGSPERVRTACEAAASAAPAWSALSLAERWAKLERFRDAIAAREDALSEAISREMGKIRSEARTEIKSLAGRFALVRSAVERDLAGGAVPGFPQEELRYRAHGVVAVIGPFNFPLHLCHAHVVPALLLGNAVVMKPSEITPLCGERYAEAAEAAGLPPGVLNVVQGRVGPALVTDPRVGALAFTGSWATGRRIVEALLDRPDVLVALEMGGKNCCVVLEDADVRQAAHEIVMGGYLTTGQRCTCTDRVLVHRSKIGALQDALIGVLRSLRFGDPEDPRAFAGPLATLDAKAKFVAAIGRARAAGADVLFAGDDGPAAFAGATLHRLKDGVHEVAGYTDEEIFGPDLCLEAIDGDDEAIAVLETSPYGFAHGVFTQDDERFARYARELRAGILNRNRSTNQASPRLPFSGVKKSGNFRPAGAWAGRNMVYPVAMQTQVAGAITPHPMIVAGLPAPDLDELEARHAREEAEDAARSLLGSPRPNDLRLPKGGELPRSTELLERFYAGNRFVREKKPMLFDHLRSSGPYFVSIDDEPLSVIDSMSQTATIPAGFSPDSVVRAFVEGGFGETPIANTDTTESRVANEFANTLRALVPGLPTVSFVNSGAEANEKAYALCRLHGPAGATKLLAFDGSFHGRTMLALYASHNPQKRLPFEIAGYEVTYAPFPVWASPGDEPSEPSGWREVCASGDAGELERRFASTQDSLLAAEARALAFVARTLARGEHFAVDVEPMQSEGGDRYVTARFHRGLRLVTRAHGVPLIMDEVQCGFGLGGTFAWHSRFGLIDAQGNPDTPDCLTFAKRAQAGVCMSRFEDPEPTSAFAASLVRGRLHAELFDAADAARVEALVRPRLAEIAKRWGHRIRNPRCEGYALAFDLPSEAEMLAYLEQRFWRGAIAFAAGTTTVRYRLSAAFDERAIDAVFDVIHRSLAWLDAHPGKKAPAWEDLPARTGKREPAPAFLLRCARRDEADAIVPKIRGLEAEVYEPARREPDERLQLPFADPHGSVVVAEAQDGTLVGCALGAPLERVAVPGADRDPMRGKDNTLYSIAITVHPRWHGKGVGRALKIAQLEHARTMKREDGTPRYLHVAARNRIPDASAMSRLADSLGAYTVFMLDKQYGDPEGVARYYRQPLLGQFAPREAPLASDAVDLSSGLVRPFELPPPSLRNALLDGSLFGPSVNKVTLLNYLTPAAVRATEWLAALYPALPHFYLTSSRDETVDKSVRLLRWHRTKATKVVSFEGAYVGHTTACARSISDPCVHRAGPAYFAWPRVPHPAVAGSAATIAALRALVGEHGAADVFGIYVEPIQERTGRVVPSDFWPLLEAFRAETKIPVVFVEHASGYYRSGRGAFFASGISFVPDVLLGWTGGQSGTVQCSSALFVDKPMTFVSTWDGDELSLVQAHHQWRAARAIDVAKASAALDEALRDVEARGAGLYRVVPDGSQLATKLASRGVRARLLPSQGLVIAPALDRAVAHARLLGEAIAS